MNQTSVEEVLVELFVPILDLDWARFYAFATASSLIIALVLQTGIFKFLSHRSDRHINQLIYLQQATPVITQRVHLPKILSLFI